MRKIEGDWVLLKPSGPMGGRFRVGGVCFNWLMYLDH